MYYFKVRNARVLRQIEHERFTRSRMEGTKLSRRRKKNIIVKGRRSAGEAAVNEPLYTLAALYIKIYLPNFLALSKENRP